MANIVELYGPGMSFYLGTAAKQPTPLEPTLEPTLATPLEKYTTALLALATSNQNLETKIRKLRTSSTQLNAGLIQLQHHVDTAHHDSLPTWQADTLTLLIQTVYTRQRRLLPGDYAVGDCDGVEYGTLTMVFTAAAKRIDRKALRRMGLSVRYQQALQRYCEIAEFRSHDPYQTEGSFAGWLVSVKEKNPGLYGFWAALFPVCYCRSVEESAEIF